MKNKGGQGSKKQVFESYMIFEEVSHGLKRGELIQVQIQTYCKLLLLTAKTPLFLNLYQVWIKISGIYNIVGMDG